MGLEQLKEIMKRNHMEDECELDTENFGEPVIFCQLAPMDDEDMKLVNQQIKEMADKENLDFEVVWGRGEYVTFKERK